MQVNNSTNTINSEHVNKLGVEIKSCYANSEQDNKSRNRCILFDDLIFYIQ